VEALIESAAVDVSARRRSYPWECDTIFGLSRWFRLSPSINAPHEQRPLKLLYGSSWVNAGHSSKRSINRINLALKDITHVINMTMRHEGQVWLIHTGTV
jgi:hypothetical protein